MVCTPIKIIIKYTTKIKVAYYLINLELRPGNNFLKLKNYNNNLLIEEQGN